MESANSKYFVPFPFAVPLFIFGFVPLHFSGPMNLLVFLFSSLYFHEPRLNNHSLPCKKSFFLPTRSAKQVLLICYYPNQF